MIKSVEHARRRAREERERIGVNNACLLETLRCMLADNHQIDLVPTDGEAFLQGSRGEVVPAEGCLYYDQKLVSSPNELLEVVAHEYGHLLLHHDQFGIGSQDLIRGSAFLNTGSPALSRYSPKSRQEAEASAFAAEFICPARDIFERWRKDEGSTLLALVNDRGATPSLVSLQLAEGLYEHIAGGIESESEVEDAKPTPEQEHAATATGSAVLIDAGPGTGKTRTLVRRVVHLVRERSVEPERILVLTFSNEAAGELQERIERSLGSDVASRILIATFHGFGVIVLNLFGHHVSLDVDFSILDEICQEELVAELVGTVSCDPLLDIKNPDQTVADAVRHINYLKDRLIGPSELAAAINGWRSEKSERDAIARARALLRLFEAYECAKASRHAVDFADLIRVPHQLLMTRQDIRDGLRTNFPWVLVDEYQDVSRATALLLEQVCGPHNQPWVVGDARQAIYRFRGAEPENVNRFGEDFPGARVFQLSENYRSSPEIISLVNRLAEWLAIPNGQGQSRARWRSGRNVVSLGDRPAFLASANSDAAERDGIVKIVREWLDGGLPAEDIAVLARRNIDVRNIALELKRRGIRAVTSGLLTAEGAGGDLAAALTVIDLYQSVARLAYALYRHQAAAVVLNEVITQLLACNIESDVEPSWSGSEQIKRIATELWRLCQQLAKSLHSGDGWSVLCDFLFFETRYLRDLLAGQENAESSVQLEEILSALSLAATYRFGHPHVSPRRSRLGLAERMRDLVTQSAPGLVPPRPCSGAVRVMTCHASKGLEFPAVAVAGQSLPDIPPPKECLPPDLRPDPNLDSLQAESLLFVGVSRAQRAVAVSYADSASGRPHSRRRRFPELLTRLGNSGCIPKLSWFLEVKDDETITMGRVWGGKTPDEVSVYSLGDGTCRIRTYLEEHLGARFRGRMRPLYPEFIQRVRKVLRRIIKISIDEMRLVTATEAGQIVDEEWPVAGAQSHPHLPIYRPRALRWAHSLAAAFDPHRFPGARFLEEPFQWADRTGVNRALKLQLIAEFEDRTGDRFAVALRVHAPDESLEDVGWSKLKDYERLPFVLLYERHGEVKPRVFFGEQGALRNFRWSTRKASDTNRERAEDARTTFECLTSGVFDGTIDDWTCDRCACRTICPGWLGAVRPRNSERS